MAPIRFNLLASTTLSVLFLAATVAPAAAECTLGMLGCTSPSPPPSTTTTAPPPAPAPPPNPGAGTPQLSSSAAAQLLDMANSERAGAGLPSMTMRDDVRDIADRWSVEMDKADAISHNDAYFTSGTRSRLGAKSLGENVGTSGSVEDVHRRLMASPPHRANLMNPRFTVVGMAAARTGGGQWYVTQDFVEPVPGGPAPAAAPAARTAGTAPPSRAARGPSAPVASAPRSAPTTVVPAPVEGIVAPSEESVVATEEPLAPVVVEGLTTADEQAMWLQAEGAAGPAPLRATPSPDRQVPGRPVAAILLLVTGGAAVAVRFALRVATGSLRTRRLALLATSAAARHAG